MQPCPLCNTPQRMMIKGNYVDNCKWERFPDMGYSFCNCRDIFFTKWENLVERNTTWNNCDHPLLKLKETYAHMGNYGIQETTISMLDPFFINWNGPHEMFHWQCRKVYILWDMHSWIKECEKVGFTIVSATRDMDVASPTPQHFHVTVRRDE